MKSEVTKTPAKEHNRLLTYANDYSTRIYPIPLCAHQSSKQIPPKDIELSRMRRLNRIHIVLDLLFKTRESE